MTFNECFPYKTVPVKNASEKAWLTTGIRISLMKKRDLSQAVKHSNDKNVIEYYKTYTKTLKKVIKCSKKTCNDQFISKAKNKARDIIRLHGI